MKNVLLIAVDKILKKIVEKKNFEKLQFQNLELYQKWSPLRLIVQKLASDLSVCFLLLFFFSGNG